MLGRIRITFKHYYVEALQQCFGILKLKQASFKFYSEGNYNVTFIKLTFIADWNWLVSVSSELRLAFE